LYLKDNFFFFVLVVVVFLLVFTRGKGRDVFISFVLIFFIRHFLDSKNKAQLAEPEGKKENIKLIFFVF